MHVAVDDKEMPNSCFSQRSAVHWEERTATVMVARGVQVLDPSL